MKLRQGMILVVLTATCLGTLTAAPQSDKQPPVSSTVRFGDPNSVAIKYRDYMFGIVKEINADQVVLSKTKFGVDQAFKFTKKTKFLRDGKPSTFDAIKVGDGIYVDLDTDKKTGDFLVKKVVGGVDVPTSPSGQ